MRQAPADAEALPGGPVDTAPAGRPHHVFIAGTGRAGTSFLVQFLSGIGLETHIERSGNGALHPQAHAGLEDTPFGGQTAGLPYVVKTPWLSEFVDDVIADPTIVIDAVIIPVRDLTEAASSRVLQELRTIHQAAPWQAASSHTSETWGTTPGGTVFSLNVVDQGRLLAVWFHQLVHRLERAEIPIVFLDFPRLAEDADYLFRKLRFVLPAGTTCERARATHARIADSRKIRVGQELRAASLAPPSRPVVEYPASDILDRVALAREVARLNAEAASTKAALVEAHAALDHTQGALVQAHASLAEAYRTAQTNAHQANAHQAHAPTSQAVSQAAAPPPSVPVRAVRKLGRILARFGD